jgi:hypothetical protein
MTGLHTIVLSPTSGDHTINFIRPTLRRLHICRSCTLLFHILHTKIEIAKPAELYISRSFNVATNV